MKVATEKVPPFDLLPIMYHVIHEQQVASGNYSSKISCWASQVLCALLHASLRNGIVNQEDPTVFNHHFNAIEKLVDVFAELEGRELAVPNKIKWDRSPLKDEYIFNDLNKKGRG